MPARVIRTLLIALIVVGLTMAVGWTLGEVVAGNPPLSLLSDANGPAPRADS